MNLAYNIAQVMHKIRVKLYPNYLPGQENTFIARTANEATLNIEQVCAALRDRGGFTGNIEDLIDHVKKYNNEMAYQLCDGFAVSNGYFTIYPNLGGTFKGLKDDPDPKTHPLTFRYRTLSALRRLAGHIAIEITGFAETDAFIDEFILEDLSSNTWYVPGDLFSLTGNKIKIEGDESSVGMYFVPVDGSLPPVKVTRLNENNPSSIRGIIPNFDAGDCKIEIRTQYSGTSGKPLKNIRVISSNFTLERA